MTSRDYELFVIGSGPGGERAAIQAAKLKKSVGVERRNVVGGMCINTGEYRWRCTNLISQLEVLNLRSTK